MARLISIRTGLEVKIGDTVYDDRGQKGEFQGFDGGKIVIENHVPMQGGFRDSYAPDIVRCRIDD